MKKKVNIQRDLTSREAISNSLQSIVNLEKVREEASNEPINENEYAKSETVQGEEDNTTHTRGAQKKRGRKAQGDV